MLGSQVLSILLAVEPWASYVVSLCVSSVIWGAMPTLEGVLR